MWWIQFEEKKGLTKELTDAHSHLYVPLLK